MNHVLIVSFIQKVLGLTEETTGSKLFTETSIHHAIGLLRTNSVKLDSPVGYTTGTAIYPTFSFLNHNCVCNTRTRKYVCIGVSVIRPPRAPWGPLDSALMNESLLSYFFLKLFQNDVSVNETKKIDNTQY